MIYNKDSNRLSAFLSFIELIVITNLFLLISNPLLVYGYIQYLFYTNTMEFNYFMVFVIIWMLVQSLSGAFLTIYTYFHTYNVSYPLFVKYYFKNMKISLILSGISSILFYLMMSLLPNDSSYFFASIIYIMIGLTFGCIIQSRFYISNKEVFKFFFIIPLVRFKEFFFVLSNLLISILIVVRIPIESILFLPGVYAIITVVSFQKMIAEMEERQ